LQLDGGFFANFFVNFFHFVPFPTFACNSPQAIFQQRVNQQTMPNLFKLSSMEKKKKGAKKRKLAKLYFFLFYGTKSVYLYTTRQ
jgi:hypothetical protein